MKSFALRLGALALLALLPLTGTGAFADERIVSLAPSVTESLCALGAEKELVGVCRYCRYPESVRALPKAGGFLDPSYEEILRLKPTLVAMSADNPRAEARLKALGFKTLALRQYSIEDILVSIAKLGDAIGRKDEAAKLVGSIKGEIEKTKRATQGLAKPRTLVCMGLAMGGGRREVFAAGANSHYDELVKIAGGVNVCGNSSLKTPTISAEGIIRLDPEVIIDLAPPDSDVKEMADGWKILSQVSAVKNSRVCVLGGDYIQIPGPRITLTLRDMLKAIHPELEGGAK